MRYAWKPLLAFALLFALVVAGLYVGYKVTEPQGDRTDAASSAGLAQAVRAAAVLPLPKAQRAAAAASSLRQ